MYSYRNTSIERRKQQVVQEKNEEGKDTVF
jgi:hypothetical protein